MTIRQTSLLSFRNEVLLKTNFECNLNLNFLFDEINFVDKTFKIIFMLLGELKEMINNKQNVPFEIKHMLLTLQVLKHLS